MKPPFHTPLVFLALTLPGAAQIGSVVRERKLNEVSGGLVGPLPQQLGIALDAIGDLNADGLTDLVAGLPYDSGVPGGFRRGGLLVVFLKADGTAAGQRRINQSVGGFTASLPDNAYFGLAVSALGDLDGDGRQELAVKSALPRSTWILFFNADGTVRQQREIPWSDPVFGGTTVASDFENYYYRPGLAGMGDLDGDGIGDLALGAPEDDDGNEDAGAIWILYLKADGSAKSAKKISETSGGFPGDLQAESLFGHSLTRLGDVNGDGFADLAGGEFGGSLGRWILLLDGNQDVLSATKIQPLTETLDSIGDLDGDGLTEFASEGLVLNFLAADGAIRKRFVTRPGLWGANAALGDLDGDGTLEVAAGDANHPETGGALFILSLARTPLVNGTGVNPLAFKEVAEPVLGQTWEAVVNCSAHRSGLATVFAFERPLAGVLLPAGELLVDPASRKLFQLFVPHAGGTASVSITVPLDLALVGVPVYTQAACSGGPGVALTNALYVRIGR